MARNVVLLVVFLSCCSLVWSQHYHHHQKGQHEGNEKAAAINEDRRMNMRLFARYSTTTEALISVITLVVPFVCYSTTGTATCMGKRRRRSVTPSIFLNTPRPDALDSSLLENLDGDGETRESHGTDRFFFTIVKTTTSVFTFTSTSTNISITVSAQALCTFAGFTGPVC
ncbi:uncharacterized protein LOC123519274 [Portunus trituberculatus]|uniref:uncharacterized protein LOC123519274 n=1 Tax=Portunus trituberculatus TaxID=210409 RepID=UPI001E1CD2D4|nr:uncharacterized protein LOC123519274 [Portunus trituberculatus]